MFAMRKAANQCDFRNTGYAHAHFLLPVFRESTGKQAFLIKMAHFSKKLEGFV